MVVFLMANATGATFYVSTTGSDAADGSLATPWLTIRHGVLTMNGGDTLNIMAGDYPDDGHVIAEFKSGTGVNTPTVVQAYNGQHVSYSPHVIGENSAHGLILSGVSNVVLNGFEVNAINCTSDGIKLDRGSTNIVITNMFVHGCGHGMGILTTGANEGDFMGSLITHCTVATNGWNASTNDAPLHQIYIQTSGMTVEFCTLIGVTNVGGGTMGVQYFGSHSNNGIFRNNFVTNCTVGLYMGSTGGTNAQVYNNVVVGGVSFGISAVGMSNVYILNNTCYTNNAQFNVDGCTNVFVDNNIAVGGYANNPGGILLNNTKDVLVRNNLSYGNYVSGNRTLDYKITGTSNNIVESSNLFARTVTATNEIYDAKFVNPPSDVRIGVGSNAINTGMTETLFSNDFVGNPRGSVWDMGAYELQTFTTLISGALLRGVLIQ